jgi:hypothetical protein
MKGWKHESYRHSLSARGISTKVRSKLGVMVRPEMFNKFSFVRGQGLSNMTKEEVDKDTNKIIGKMYDKLDKKIDKTNNILDDREKRSDDVSESAKKERMSKEDVLAMAEHWDKLKEEDDELDNLWSSKKKVSSMAWKKNSETSNYITDSDWDNDIDERRVIKDDPSKIIKLLEELSVNTSVPDDDIDYYAKKIVDDESVRVPYVVFGADLNEIVDYGNIAELRAAEKAGIEEVPLVMFKTISFEDDFDKRLRN